VIDLDSPEYPEVSHTVPMPLPMSTSIPVPIPAARTVPTRTRVLRAAMVLITMASASAAAPPNPARTATPSLAKDPADLAYTAAAVRFLDTYRSTGMAGATGDIKDCYTRAGSTFQFGCIALDATAFVMTYAFAQNGFPPPTDYLGEPAFRARVKTQLRLAGMKDDTQMTAYTNALIRRCGDTLLAESNRRGPAKSSSE